MLTYMHTYLYETYVCTIAKRSILTEFLIARLYLQIRFPTAWTIKCFIGQ